MTIILFVIDTSASMNQRTYLGTSFMDVAKGAVELFMKVTRKNMMFVVFVLDLFYF
jgi:Mg-chelatase subunit ChlD